MSEHTHASQLEKTIVLTQQEFKSIPGYSTQKSATYWRGQIMATLEELGARGYGYVEGNLVFQLNIDVADGMKRTLNFRMRPALITVKTQRRGHAVQNVVHEEVTWKLLYEYMRNKIAILKVGVLDVLEEMAGSVTMITDQGEMSFGEVMRILAERDKLTQVIQLEDMRTRT